MAWKDTGASRLEAAFTRKGWGAKAEFARLHKVDASTVSRWLAGTQVPDADDLLALCGFLGLPTADALVGLPLPKGQDQARYHLEALQEYIKRTRGNLDDNGNSER